MAAPLFTTRARRPILPPLDLPSLSPPTMTSPVNEKDLLPCIMITPSSPVHDSDFEIFYFEPEKRSPGFFSNVLDVLSSPSRHPIALPYTPDTLPYGQSPVSNNRWSAVKRIRAFVLLMAAAFIALHLLVLPHGDEGFYNVFQGHPGSDKTYGSASVWEGWEVPPASNSKAMTTATLDDVLTTTTAEAQPAGSSSTTVEMGL